jgi:hypothetical protein
MEPITKSILELNNGLELYGYTNRTIKSYIWHVSQFIIAELSKRDYLLRLIEKQQSSAPVRLANTAITFY